MRARAALATLAAGLFALAGCGPAPVPRGPDARLPGLAGTHVALPPMRRFAAGRASPPARSNRQMAQDFIDLTFHLETGRDLPVLTRFEGPVTLALSGPVPATAAADLGRVLARLRAEAGIDIARTDGPAAITIEFLPRRTMRAQVPQAACFVAPGVSSWGEYRRARADTLDWTRLSTRTRAAIFIPDDIAPQEVRDCLNEELAQALGPLNDLFRLPDSVFNDDNIHGVLTGFDMLMLRVTYAPELQSGMGPEAVAAAVPGILARLNPRGERIGGAPTDPTPRAFVEAIDEALGPGGRGMGARRAAIGRAIDIAERRGWRDTRAGFAWLALGRLSEVADPSAAYEAFSRAAAIYHADPGLALQGAHADMELAALALTQGQPAAVETLVAGALPRAAAAENAALLATLLMLRAEALQIEGQESAAAAARLDSLGWARYGFGSDADVIGWMRGMAALNPVRGQTPDRFASLQ
ncbi:MAG: DUF2927 domain-containing protein [Defluviimonas sp.]|uniref:DUF2927 domain-containing protein n=1 Tax=Albidovulum sp. TaxID=1872424 RepID=UPI002A2BCC10|nr:DUF2927 domain-containing protein [Defluviimonas sp.]